MRKALILTNTGLIAVGMLAGCGSKSSTQGRPLAINDFIVQTPADPERRPLERRPQSDYNQVGLDLMDPRVEDGQEDSVSGVSDVVQQEVRAPGSEAEKKTGGPTTRPLATGSSGQYLTLGGVVAMVNETPIYANKVLKTLDPLLSAKAKELDLEHFRTAATSEVGRQVQEFIRAEVEFAAAQKNLAADDRKLADFLTMQWRQRKVTDSGGSVQLARKRAQAEGTDFDEMCQEQYRLLMTQIYYQKKVIPRIQVTADDMRRYYDGNRDAVFTEHDQVRFRLIKIDVKQSGDGDRAKALEKAKDLWEKAKANPSNFAELATTNDDPSLLKRGGLVDWVDKGAFAIDKVSDAVFAIQAGEITDIIDAGKAFYIAKVEERKMGRVLPFEDESVQDKIRVTLRSEQFRVLRDAVQESLKREAAITVNPEMMTTTVEMAMQRYAAWNAGARAD